MGSMSSAVAVLLIHMDSTALTSMKPATVRPAWPPNTLSTARAMRRCTPQRSTVAASTKPLRARKMMRWP